MLDPNLTLKPITRLEIVSIILREVLKIHLLVELQPISIKTIVLKFEGSKPAITEMHCKIRQVMDPIEALHSVRVFKVEEEVAERRSQRVLTRE